MAIHYNKIARFVLSALVLLVANLHCLAVWAEWPNDMSIKRIHPVLQFSKPSQVKSERLDASIFLKLNGLYNDSSMVDYLRDDMLEGEVAACRGLERIVRGRTQAEVKELIGLPELSTGSVAGWADSTPDQENWFYYMGYCSIAVRVAFVGGHCVFAQVCDKDKRSCFEEAIFEEIKKRSIGRTEAEISCSLPKPMKPSATSNYWGECDDLTKWVESKTDWTYSAGNDFYLLFHFTEDKCDDVKRSLVFH